MYAADLHIHSKYSRATSRDCDAPHLELWARYKGLGLIGTGDLTHPAWRQALQEALEPAEEGLYTLKEEARWTCGPGARAWAWWAPGISPTPPGGRSWRKCWRRPGKDCTG